MLSAVGPPVTVRVPAKINLHLAVGDLRPDGYHDLVTVFQALSITDEVSVTAAVPGAVEPGVTVSPIDGVDASEVPADTDQPGLARGRGARPPRRPRPPTSASVCARRSRSRAGWRAAAPTPPARCWRPPRSGGSTWGATTSWRSRPRSAPTWPSPCTAAPRSAPGAASGSSRCSRATRSTGCVAVADHGLSTPTVFAELDRLRDRPEAPRRVGDVEPVLEALASGEARSLALLLGNDLQAAAVSLDPGLRRTLRAGVDAGALAGVVSGSGPTCVFLCAGQDAAVRVAAELAGAGVCRTVRVAHGPVPGARVTDGGGPPPRRPAPAQLRPRSRRLRLTSSVLPGRPTVPNLVNLESVSIGFGAPKPVLDGVSLGVDTGDRIGVVGRNGGGKSTLVKVLAGTLTPDAGRRSPVGGLQMALVSQQTQLSGATVRDAVLGGPVPDHEWAADARSRAVVEGLRPGGDRGLDASVDGLSGGERQRIALCAALVQDLDLLVLDEPTNHLDVEGIGWLAEHLLARRTALVVVTHDRWFLDTVASRTWEVVDGHVEQYEGGYGDWIFARAERARLSDAAEQRRQNLARKELAWLRRGPQARTSKPKYRVEAAEALIADVPAPARHRRARDDGQAPPRAHGRRARGRHA